MCTPIGGCILGRQPAAAAAAAVDSGQLSPALSHHFAAPLVWEAIALGMQPTGEPVIYCNVRVPVKESGQMQGNKISLERRQDD